VRLPCRWITPGFCDGLDFLTIRVRATAWHHGREIGSNNYVRGGRLKFHQLHRRIGILLRIRFEISLGTSSKCSIAFLSK
jgi:hypothetical protein